MHCGWQQATEREKRNEEWWRIAREKPGYHGSIWIDPATGTVERLTLIADVKGEADLVTLDVLVDYGPVSIGGKSYICPVRSLALSAIAASVKTTTQGLTTEWLNESLFTKYHLFGSTTRIITESAALPPAEGSKEADGGEASTGSPATPELPVTIPTPSKDVSAISGGTQTPPVHSEVDTAPTSAPGSAIASQGGAKEEAPPSNTEAGPPPTEASKPPEPETSKAAAEQTAESSPIFPDKGGEPTMSLDVNEVSVPVVVLDKHDKAVGGLGKEDFEVFDDGKRQPITGFSMLHTGAPTPGSDIGTSEQEAVSAPQRYVVYLFDDRHMDPADLALAKRAALKLLAQPMAPNETADVLSMMGVSSGLTRDADTLKAAVNKLTLHPLDSQSSDPCLGMDYYTADQIQNKRNPEVTGIAVKKVKQCTQLQSFEPGGGGPELGGDSDIYHSMVYREASRVLAKGDEDTQLSLISIENVVRVMARLPGRRILIFVSPGFLTLSQDALHRTSEILEAAANANVVINTLDVRGTYDCEMSVASATLAESQTQWNGNTMLDQLIAMQMNENAMGALADGTGGEFFHNNNNLTAGLKQLAAAP